MPAPNQLHRVLYIFFFILFIVISASAQQDDGTEKSEIYQGGKKVTKGSRTPNDGIRETIKHYDANGTLRESKITDEENDGRKIVTHEFRDCKGGVTYREYTITKKNGDELYHETIRYDKDGKALAYGYRKTLNEKGEEVIFKYNKEKKDWVREEKALDSIPNEVYFMQDIGLCPISSLKLEVGGKYSILNANFDPKNEWLHGWGADVFYNIFKKGAVGVMYSRHYKSEGDADFNLSFLHGAYKMNINSESLREVRTFSPNIFFGLGIAKYKNEISIPGGIKFETSDQCISPLIGAAVDMQAMKRFSFRLGIEYLPTFFDDDTQHNLRFNAGGTVGIFRAQRNFSN